MEDNPYESPRIESDDIPNPLKKWVAVAGKFFVAAFLGLMSLVSLALVLAGLLALGYGNLAKGSLAAVGGGAIGLLVVAAGVQFARRRVT
jgi:hypothetical protein